MSELLSPFEIRARKMERLNLLVEEAEILLKETGQLAQACTIEPEPDENPDENNDPFAYTHTQQGQAHNPAQSETALVPFEDPAEKNEIERAAQKTHPRPVLGNTDARTAPAQ